MYKRQALSALVGPKGFLLYNPIIAIALWGLVRAIRDQGRFYYEAIVVAAGSSAVVLYYLMATNNYGGWSYSIRWFVPVSYTHLDVYKRQIPGCRVNDPGACQSRHQHGAYAAKGRM